MKFKKIVVCMLVCLIASTAIFAGGASEAPEGEKTPLTMWFWGAAPGQQEAMDKVLVSKFNATHPEYELTVEYRPSVNKDMAVALAAGEGPDIIYESSPSLSLIYIQSGKYADLTEYSKKFGWEDKIIKPMYDSSSVDGHLYSIPMGLNYIGIVYNEKTLADHGWSVPTTVEELENIMDEAMAQGMYASVTGNKGWKPTNEDYASLFLTNFAGTDEVYKCLMNEQDWNSEAIRFALDKSTEYYKKGYLCSDYFNMDWAEAAQLLIDGKSPFFFGPIKFIQNLPAYMDDTNKDDIKFTVFPAGREGINPSYTIGATGILAINANTDHKDACADFINMFVSNEFVEEMAQTWPGYWGVPLKTLDKLDTSTSTGLTKAYLDSLIVASAEIDKGNFGYYCSSYMPPETFDLFCNIENLWFDQTTTDKFLDEIDTAFEREYKQNLVPPVPAPVH